MREHAASAVVLACLLVPFFAANGQQATGAAAPTNPAQAAPAVTPNNVKLHGALMDGKRCAVALSRSGVGLGLPAPGHKFVDPILRPAVDEARQQFGHVGLWIDVVEFAGLDQRSHASPIFAALVAARKK